MPREGRAAFHGSIGMLKPGTPGLLLVRTIFTAGRVMEYDQEYRRHDAIRIHVDLSIPADPDRP